ESTDPRNGQGSEEPRQMATDMQAVTREIVRADAERGRFLAELVEGTRAQLQELGASRRRTRDELLARLERQRAEIAPAVRAQLDELTRERVRMARETRAHLALDRAGLAHVTQTLIVQLHASRTAAAREQRRQLANTDRARRRAARTLTQTR